MNKFCPNCGAETSEASKFCTSCGHSYNGEPATQPQAQAQTSGGSTITLPDVDLSKVSPIAKGYGNYLLELLKNPSKSLQLTPSLNGWIHLAMLFVFNCLTLLVIISSVPYFEFNKFSTFFTGLIAQGFIFAVAVISALCVLLLKKSPRSILDIVTQLAGYLTPLVVMSAAILFLTLLESYDIASMLVMAIFTFAILGFNMYLIETDNNGKLDTLYTTLIGNIIFIIIFYIVGGIVLESLYDRFFGILEYYF